MASRKGSKNIIGGQVKTNVLTVFADIGGIKHMSKWAQEHPTEFYKIYAKLMPTEIDANVSGTLKAVFKSGDKVLEIGATTDVS